MIARIWHGWTTVAQADAYEQLLRHEIFEGINSRKLPGFLGIDLLRKSGESEVEFITVMWFESLADVRAFAGEDFETAVVPPSAQALLKRFDAKSAHFEVRDRFRP
jgi:hypothetical protein